MPFVVIIRKKRYNRNRIMRRALPMKKKWLCAWLIQIVIMLIVCVLQALSYMLSVILYDILLWGMVPLAGLLTAYRAVKRGLLNYAAWIAPPVCLYFSHLIVWGFAPSAGAALLSAFVSLIGAAAGEVSVQRSQRSKH